MSRFPPLAEPYPDWFADAMARVTPPGSAPLALFRTIATSRRAWDKFAGGSLLDKGPLSLREREIVIDRTTARCECDYEWGVHIALFADRVGLSPQQVEATAAATIDPALWTPAEATLIATVDTLLDRRQLSPDDYAALQAHFSAEQIMEIVQLIAFYHGVALICGAFDIQQEAGTPAIQRGTA